MTCWSPARIQALDRRRAAIHEAGHFTIAAHFGVRSAEAWIFPYGQGERDPTEDKTWGGQASYLTLDKKRLSANRRRMFAVAGFVVESVWGCRRDADGPAWADFLDDDAAMSATDWAGAGCDPGRPNGPA